MTESEEQVGEGMSTLAIMRDIRVPVTTTHELADGTTYEVPLKQLDENGNLAQVYEYKRTRMVAQPYNRYGFSSIVKKALRAAVDEIAGVVEPQPREQKQAETSKWLICTNIVGAIVGYQRIGEDGNGTGKVYTESEYLGIIAAEQAAQ
jgi:hypothetical protein